MYSMVNLFHDCAPCGVTKMGAKIGKFLDSELPFEQLLSFGGYIYSPAYKLTSNSGASLCQFWSSVALPHLGGRIPTWLCHKVRYAETGLFSWEKNMETMKCDVFIFLHSSDPLHDFPSLLQLPSVMTPEGFS